MSRDTFYLPTPISGDDPLQRCNLDLYGSTPHEPHAWAELVTSPPVGLVTALNKPAPPTLTGWRCPGHDPKRGMTEEDRQRLTDEVLRRVGERLRVSVSDQLRSTVRAARMRSHPFAFNPYDLIDPSTIKAYWPEEQP